MITYYTDGSASPNPGPGGFSVIRDMKPAVLGGEPSGAITTNIRMEGGLAEYFGVDATIIRIIAVVLLLPGWLPGFVPYVILWIIVPEEPTA